MPTYTVTTTAGLYSETRKPREAVKDYLVLIRDGQHPHLFVDDAEVAITRPTAVQARHILRGSGSPESDLDLLVREIEPLPVAQIAGLDDLTWHVPPHYAGRRPEVAFASDREIGLIRRVFHADGATVYHFLPWNLVFRQFRPERFVFHDWLQEASHSALDGWRPAEPA